MTAFCTGAIASAECSSTSARRCMIELIASRDALARALFAVDHALAQFARQHVLAVVEAIGHARDLLAHLLDRLRAAAFDGADALFQALGEAADFEAHAVERASFAALDLVEALLQRRRHLATVLRAPRRRRRRRCAIPPRADACRPFPTCAGFRARSLRSFALGGVRRRRGGGSRPRARLPALRPQRLRARPAVAPASSMRASPTMCATSCAMRVEPLLQHRAHGFGFLRAPRALLDARAERGDSFFQRADRGVGGDSRFRRCARSGAAAPRPASSPRHRLLRASRRRFDSRQTRASNAASASVTGLASRLGFERGEALGDILLRVAQIGQIDRARRRRRCLQPASAAPTSVSCALRRSAIAAPAAWRRPPCVSRAPASARSMRAISAACSPLQRIDSADALGDLAFEPHHFFQQRFARAARFVAVSVRTSAIAVSTARRVDVSVSAEALAQLLLQTAQFVHRVGGRFAGLTRRFFSNARALRQRLLQRAVAAFHLVA